MPLVAEFSQCGANRLKDKPAVFLDRDGTIIEDRGYLKDPSQVVFFDDTASSLRKLSEFFDLFIVTNQSGVSQGIISLEDVRRVNSYIESTLNKQGIRFADIYVCPHDHSDACDCIKPKPYFMYKAAREHGIDLAHSFAIGDHPHDVVFAENVGATGIFVLSGHGEKHRDEIPATAPVASGILDAVEMIIKMRKAAYP